MSGGQRLALLGAAVAVAIAAVIVIGLGGEEEPVPPAPAGEGTVERPSNEAGERSNPEPEPEVAKIEVEGGAPVGGVTRVEASKGDRVRLAIASDTPGQVHVHGYDLFEELRAGKTTRVEFTADLDGAFDIELEETHTQLAELRVGP